MCLKRIAYLPKSRGDPEGLLPEQLGPQRSPLSLHDCRQGPETRAPPSQPPHQLPRQSPPTPCTLSGSCLPPPVISGHLSRLGPFVTIRGMSCKYLLMPPDAQGPGDTAPPALAESPWPSRQPDPSSRFPFSRQSPDQTLPSLRSQPRVTRDLASQQM